MGRHTNIWRPDTCDCEIEFEFDDSVPAENRVHTGSRVIKACPLHPQTEFTNCHDHYSHVTDQNRRKNILLGKMLEAHPELAKTLDNGARVLREDIDYIHSYKGRGKNVTLEVEFIDTKQTPDFSFQKKHKDSIAKIAKEEFGDGKVTVK